MDAHAVADVKLLGFEALVIDNDSAVGQYAVDVGENQSDVLAALVEGHQGIGDKFLFGILVIFYAHVFLL